MNLDQVKHHPHDSDFIKEQIWQAPFDMRSRLLHNYDNAYKKISNDGTIPAHKRVNAARHYCNSALRGSIANLGTTYLPLAR